MRQPLPPFVDVVVVGAGSGGAVVASRVSEDGSRRVLLLEAGPDVPSSDPADWPADLRDGRRNSLRDHDWGYVHDPTPGQVRMPLPRGKVVGGSSAVNTCIALRGTPEDYDAWVDAGAEGWGWDDVLPAFRRLERDLDVGEPGVDAAWHGTDGPLPVRRPRRADLSRWQAAFDDAADAAGFPACADTNAPDAWGHGPHAFNRIDGVRRNAAMGWLSPEVRARPNLDVRGGVFTRRVRFEGRRAVGVDVEVDGEAVFVGARLVVLAGGVFGTPGVLLRSGVGADEDVRRVGAEPVAEVPAVASRLLDHPGGAIFFAPIRPGVADLSVPIIQNVLRVPSRVSGLRNDLQIQAGAFVHFPWFRAPLVTLMANIGRTYGEGRLRFVGHDPHAPPRIDSRLLEHPDDKARLVEALQLAEALSRETPLHRLARPIVPMRGAIRDTARFERAIVRVSGSGYHPCGTVPMGRDDDPRAATDARGRVKGVDGVVVADASLMPVIPTANIHLATLMIGERIGAWLRDG